MSGLLGAVVDADYVHIGKTVEPTAVDHRFPSMKWYDIRENDRSISPEVTSRARESAAAVLTPGDVGFVILHQCGESFFFLLICRWRHNNELWQTVVATSMTGEFEPVTESQDRATFCVWELTVVHAERDAWTALLRSDRSASAVDDYLAAGYAGPA